MPFVQFASGMVVKLDDLFMSLETIFNSKEATEKFIEENILIRNGKYAMTEAEQENYELMLAEEKESFDSFLNKL